MNNFNIRQIVWYVIVILLFLSSSLLDITGLDNLWDFVSYTIPIFSIIIYSSFSIILFTMDKFSVRTMKQHLINQYQPHSISLVLLDVIFYGLFVVLFAYHAEFVRAVIWLLFISCKSLFFVALRTPDYEKMKDAI